MNLKLLSFFALINSAYIDGSAPFSEDAINTVDITVGSVIQLTKQLEINPGYAKFFLNPQETVIIDDLRKSHGFSTALIPYTNIAYLMRASLLLDNTLSDLYIKNRAKTLDTGIEQERLSEQKRGFSEACSLHTVTPYAKAIDEAVSDYSTSYTAKLKSKIPADQLSDELHTRFREFEKNHRKTISEETFRHSIKLKAAGALHQSGITTIAAKVPLPTVRRVTYTPSVPAVDTDGLSGLLDKIDTLSIKDPEENQAGKVVKKPGHHLARTKPY